MMAAQSTELLAQWRIEVTAPAGTCPDPDMDGDAFDVFMESITEAVEAGIAAAQSRLAERRPEVTLVTFD